MLRSWQRFWGGQNFSLRFATAVTEHAYIRKKTQDLTRTLSNLAIVLFLTIAVSWLLTVHLTCTNPQVECTPAEVEVTWIRLAMVAVMLVTSLGTFAFARLGGFQRCFSPEGTEYAVVVLIVSSQILLTCFDYAYLARIVGHGESEGFKGMRFTETYVLLSIDSFITVSHLALPIRWSVLLPSEIAAMLIYGVLAFGVGSSEPEHAMMYGMILAFLIFGSAIGKRTIERHERALFLNTLEEKKLRAQLEFKLSEKTDLETVIVTTRGSDDASSTAPTMASAQLFNEIGSKSSTLHSQLQQIAELGSREHWLISTDKVEIITRRILGGGSFGIVVAGILHGSAVAIKLPRKESSFLKSFATLANELRILRHVRNPNVVLFHGACVDFVHGELAIVEELVDGPSLEAFLSGGRGSPCKPPDDPARHHLVLGLCCGLQYLHAHEPCIVHGDLKPNNVRVEVLCNGPRVKLLDFGLSRLIKGNPKPLGGTLTWMAPELVSSKLSSAKLPLMPDPAADVFSFGRLLYFVATGVKPLHGCAISDIQMAAERGQVLPQYWPSDSSSFALFCAPISERCLSQSSASRPHIKDVHEEFSRLRTHPETCDGADEDRDADSSFDRRRRMYLPSERARWHPGLQSIREAVGHMEQDFSTWSFCAKGSDEVCEVGSSLMGPPSASL